MKKRRAHISRPHLPCTASLLCPAIHPGFKSLRASRPTLNCFRIFTQCMCSRSSPALSPDCVQEPQMIKLFYCRLLACLSRTASACLETMETNKNITCSNLKASEETFALSLNIMSIPEKCDTFLSHIWFSPGFDFHLPVCPQLLQTFVDLSFPGNPKWFGI